MRKTLIALMFAAAPPTVAMAVPHRLQALKPAHLPCTWSATTVAQAQACIAAQVLALSVIWTCHVNSVSRSTA